MAGPDVRPTSGNYPLSWPRRSGLGDVCQVHPHPAWGSTHTARGRTEVLGHRQLGLETVCWVKSQWAVIWKILGPVNTGVLLSDHPSLDFLAGPPVPGLLQASSIQPMELVVSC